MSGGFNNPIIGGGGALVYPAIHSPNFVHNASGWSINKDGSLEANNATIRGTITAGTFKGTNFIINSTGAFFYSGAPATGNLIASIAAASGADDGFGNPYQSGFTVYAAGGNKLQMSAGQLTFTPNGVTTPAVISAGNNGPTGQLSIGSPAVTGDGANITLISGQNAGAVQAIIQLLSGNNAPQVQIGSGSSNGIDGNSLVTSKVIAWDPVNVGSLETWHPITPDVGVWSAVAGSAAPSYQLFCGELQLTGCVNYGSSQTVSRALNSANPLPPAYRPKTLKVYRGLSGVGNRGGVQIDATGVITMLASTAFPAQYCEIDGTLPLNL